MLVPGSWMKIAGTLFRPWAGAAVQTLSGRAVQLAITETPDPALIDIAVQGVIEQVVKGVVVTGESGSVTVPDECAVVRLERPFPAPRGGEWPPGITRVLVIPRFEGYRLWALRLTYIAVNVYAIDEQLESAPGEVFRRDFFSICLMRLHG